jgi:chemotaxis family two-component system response regulator Rcp1
MVAAAVPKTILMVDDNPGDLGLVRQVLDDVKGVALHAVPNVVQAHAFLTKRRPFHESPTPDLVILDLRMPMSSGHGIISLVKQGLKLPHTKVVVFTSSLLDEDRFLCEELGADDFICKPTDWSDWQGTIVRVLTRHRLLSG